MTLITEAYRRANEMLHETTAYGTTAPRFMAAIDQAATHYKVRDLIDYGSGPREHVKAAFGERARSYDPCVPHLAADPEPADMLVSCDVLEHIEPELLDNVLDHMASLSRRVAFLTIATGPAKKTLPDGRNAHLIQEGSGFWLPRIMQRWRLMHFQDIGPELVCIVEARA